ncbi:hypothetical protein O3M35_009161 [Rhynocoris fuscipes]|uniref:Laccase n=1 Tax=Rhynocoris fuscipes TaxID=488301 RepID=A0AAW1D2R5_9HEMI
MKWYYSLLGLYFLINKSQSQDESIFSILTKNQRNFVDNKEPVTTTEVSEEMTTILYSDFYSLPSTESISTSSSEQPDLNEPVEDEFDDEEEEEEFDFPRHYDLERERYTKNDKHPCKRECIKGEPPKTCFYHFKVEEYESMSKACYNCPYNLTDCYRPDCIATDGVQRSLVVINRMLPGPSIEVCHNDEVIIDLENNLLEGTTSVHWHGQHQKESPYMDGVPFVTQCPVPPKNTFRYRYVAATSGTHFWHSHSGTQRADGAFGPLIVRKPRESDPFSKLYHYDLSEHTITVLDWSHQLGIALFTAHHHSDGDNKPPTIQVNGRGMYRPFPSTNNSLIYTPPASFVVEKGFRYRFRIINAGILNCPIEMSIDNHTIIAISSDGTDFMPAEVDSLVTYAGERWDFILDASADIGDYWIRFRGLMDCDERFTSAHMAAVLHYKGAYGSGYPPEPLSYHLADRGGLVLNALNAPANDPSSINAPDLNSTIPPDESLKPLADRKLILAYDFNPIDNEHFFKKNVYGFTNVSKRHRILTPQFNHVSLKLQSFPLLSQPEDIKPTTFCNHSQLQDCKDRYCECTNVVELKLGEIVEVILVDIGIPYDANHPFHLHGHQFRVVAMDRLGSNVTVEKVLELDEYGLINRNLKTAVVKDTVTVPDGGYTVIRFKADNPGYWMFHCHIEFHVELGMAILFKVGSHTDFPPVPSGFPRCGNYMPALTNVKPSSSTSTTRTTTRIPEPKENEVNFGQTWEYNTTDISSSNEDKPSVISVSYWWPLHKQRTSFAISLKANYCIIINSFFIYYFVNKT